MTLVEKIQKKADAIARRCKDDIYMISVFAIDDPEYEGFGSIVVEFQTYGGPIVKNGNIVGDHCHLVAHGMMDNALKEIGAFLVRDYEGDGDPHVTLDGYRVAFH